jgi:hypothetical protein
MDRLARIVFSEPLDVLELVGIAAALIAAALLIRHASPGHVALDALVVASAVGPFLVRHCVRALRRGQRAGA